MANDDSDVSAITLSGDDEPKQKASPPPKSAPKVAGRAVGSSRAAVTGDNTASKPGRKGGRRKGRVSFQVEGDEEGDYDDDGNDLNADEPGRDGDGDEGADEDGAVEDETKPLGWSYFRKRDATEGPATWAEVDVGELRFVAENLVRSTTKRASQADDVIQKIFQAAPGDEESLVADPLGRGVIDPVTLTLGKRSKMQAARQAQPSSGEKGLKATMRTFRTARLGALQQQQQQPGLEGGGGASQKPATAAVASAAGSGLDEETRKVLPNQEGFDPETYLATFHAESGMNQLEKGLRSLSRELSERTGQLKLLIRNNFERFINCKDAIDDIHAKMRKTLVRGGGGGGATLPSAAGPGTAGAAQPPSSQQQQQQTVATERVFRSLEQVEGQACRTFGPILDRAAKADRIRAVASLLQRFDHLFAAPQRVMELAGRGELEQVVREYKRTNMLIRPTPTTARVWVSLYAEIEKRVTDVYVAVKQLVTEPPPEEDRPMGQDGPILPLNGMASTSTATAAVSGAVAYGGDAARQRLSLLPDYLLFLALLQQERLPAAREEDAMRLYVSRLETHTVARIQACDKQHTEQLGQLVAAWMRATMAGGGGRGSSNSAVAATAAALRAASSGVASLQASLTTIPRLDAIGRPAAGTKARSEVEEAAVNGAGGPGRNSNSSKAQGRGGERQGDGDVEDPASLSDGDEDDLDDEGEAAEVAFLLWQASGQMPTASSAFLGGGNAANMPYHIRAELRRLVQEPGGTYGVGDGPPTSCNYHGGSSVWGGGAAAAAASVEPLPSSAFAPAPRLTTAQRQWVSYVCSVSALLMWSVPGLWATCNSPKYSNNADFKDEAREGLERGPSLARRLVESLCAMYAVRLRRAMQSLARAGPMQPGLPLIIKDACHLWSSLRRVGVGTRALSSLRGSVLAALSAHVRVLEDHLAALPQLLFGADDFRLDLLAPDQHPVTSLPRRLEEEVGVALLHYQWALAAVVEAAGSVGDVPADSGWRPVQGSVFACFSLLTEALAEYARSLYSSGQEDGGSSGRKDTKRSSPIKTTSSSLSSDPEAASNVAAAVGSQGSPAAPLPAARAPRPGSAAASRVGGSGGSSNSSSRQGTTDATSDAVGAGEDGVPTRGGSMWSATGGGGGGSGKDDVRVLLVIGNSAVIRTRVMPGLVERYRKLLAPTPDAAATCQRRLRELTSAMRRSNEALGSSYLGRKEADVQAAVQAYIAAATTPMLAPVGAAGASKRQLRGKGEAATAVGAGAGTGATQAALLSGPSGPSTGCCSLLQLLTVIHNEALAYSPSNLRSFMEALAERLVGELAPACRKLSARAGGGGGSSGAVKGDAGASVEQLVQLWADLHFLTVVLRPLVTDALMADLREAKVDLCAAISVRQRARHYRPGSKAAAALADLRDGEAISAALEELLAADVAAWLRLHALNVRCFAAAAVATAAAAAVPQQAPASAQAASQGASAGGKARSIHDIGAGADDASSSAPSSSSSRRVRREQRERGKEVVGRGY